MRPMVSSETVHRSGVLFSWTTVAVTASITVTALVVLALYGIYPAAAPPLETWEWLVDASVASALVMLILGWPVWYILEAE